VEFATKPALARAMIVRALDAGAPASWVAGDEVYGSDPQLRAELQQRRIGYVLAVTRDHRVPTGAGKIRVDALAVRVPTHGWQRLSCGKAAKGHRYHDGRWSTSPSPTYPGNTGC
jgi:SRSO17 transposase